MARPPFGQVGLGVFVWVSFVWHGRLQAGPEALLLHWQGQRPGPQASGPLGGEVRGCEVGRSEWVSCLEGQALHIIHNGHISLYIILYTCADIYDMSTNDDDL